jgi:predicted nucleotidyltransferase
MLDDALHLTPTEKLALADIKRRVSALFPVHEYILFGSKARGDFEPESDVDLLIVTDRKLSHELFEANLRYDTLFPMITVARGDWEGDL